MRSLLDHLLIISYINCHCKCNIFRAPDHDNLASSSHKPSTGWFVSMATVPTVQIECLNSTGMALIFIVPTAHNLRPAKEPVYRIFRIQYPLPH